MEEQFDWPGLGKDRVAVTGLLVMACGGGWTLETGGGALSPTELTPDTAEGTDTAAGSLPTLIKARDYMI